MLFLRELRWGILGYHCDQIKDSELCHRRDVLLGRLDVE
jgi:hypothetical protein